MRKKLRINKRGGALAFAVVLIVILIMLALGFFLISLYFGGAQETKDAVNAGALNVAKQSLGVTVPVGSGDRRSFLMSWITAKYH